MSEQLPYFALAVILLHCRGVDGDNCDLVFPMAEVPEGGFGAFLEECQKQALSGGYRVLTDEEYIEEARSALAQRSGKLLIDASQQYSRDKRVNDGLSGEILRLHKGREGGDA